MTPQFAYTHLNIASAGTYVVKSGPGILHSIVINTTAASAITVYDNTSAADPKIATIANSPVIGSTFAYDVAFANGLTIVTAGASNITVAYK
jgi:hypothetical protein